VGDTLLVLELVRGACEDLEVGLRARSD